MPKPIEEFVATGRRKTAVASVRLRPGGSGKVDINGKAFEAYFPLEIQREMALSPLGVLGLSGRYDIIIRTRGGGLEGQVIATRLGVARALLVEEETRKPELKSAGFLKRDPRKKERKKYGRKKARKRPQFSKR